MSVYILGISCFFHDSAACLLRDGEVVAAAQEERFTRVKHDASFPRFAINYCLEQMGINDEDLDEVVFYEDVMLLLDRIASEVVVHPFPVAKLQLKKILSSWNNGKINPEGIIAQNLPDYKGNISFIEHHCAHASSAFYPSPFSNAAILTVDGVGEWSTTTICHGVGQKIKLLKKLNYPNSLGLFYSAVTNYLGFKVNSGEYKVMGLAPYGKPIYYSKIMNEIVSLFDDGSLILNTDFFDLSGINPIASPAWETLFGKNSRKPESELSKFHMDIAASAQKVTETVMLSLAREAKRITGANYLCLSGGVALNCVANGRILSEGIFNDIWIQPAAGDAGNALGAAFFAWFNKYHSTGRVVAKQDLMQGSFLGPEFKKNEIISFLELYGFPYKELKPLELGKVVADLLIEQKVIGIFDGRMEFGPRSLGARSIIGDPRSPQMLKKMNLQIKFRESFRPFAPIVKEEKVSEWFELDRKSPYMLLVAQVKEEKCVQSKPSDKKLEGDLSQMRSEISAVTHVDFSARVQTISKSSKLSIRKILDEFDKRTGVPVLINTSFNVRSEPIVMTPGDAYRCMMRSNIDAILLGDCLVLREEQPPWIETKDWREDFQSD